LGDSRAGSGGTFGTRNSRNGHETAKGIVLDERVIWLGRSEIGVDDCESTPVDDAVYP
jgi:hypothetical protein